MQSQGLNAVGVTAKVPVIKLQLGETKFDIVIAKKHEDGEDQISKSILAGWASLPKMDELALHPTFVIVSKALKLWAEINGIYGVAKGLNSVSICLMLMALQKADQFVTAAQGFTKFFEWYTSYNFAQAICLQPGTPSEAPASAMRVFLPGTQINVTEKVTPALLEKIKEKLAEADKILKGPPEEWITLFMKDSIM